jgi:hypothetical protein
MAKKAAPAKPPTPTRKGMSDQHKAALAEGREQGRAVRRYLEALEQNRPKRGRKRTRDTVERRLAAVEEQLAAAEPLGRLHLIQERIDLQDELANMNGDGVDLGALEDAFVEAAPAYGARRGITYSAWRAAGVPPAVLRRAGIGRSS